MKKKLQGSLGDLISRINALGVKFGLWFEPEMVNEDSDLYREHPDWAIQIPEGKPVKGRNQLLLDFSRKEVVDAVYEQMCQVLDQGNIEYVKWDMNRSMAEVYSMTAEEQGSVQYDYMLGLYDFLERIISRSSRPSDRKAAVVVEVVLTRECCIIHHRSGAVTIPMQWIV